MPKRTEIRRYPARAQLSVLRSVILLASVLSTAAITGCAADAESNAEDIPMPAEVADSVPPSPVGAPAIAPDDERVPEPVGVMGASWTAEETNVERPMAGAATLREVRTAEHTDFDRIVLDFGADSVPGYRVGYVDRPVRQCGSGNVVPLAGDGWLSIAVQPANAHTEAGEPTVREREQTPRLPVVLELKLICDFEAIVEVVAGVSSPGRYRVFELTEPGRLVIDIRH